LRCLLCLLCGWRVAPPRSSSLPLSTPPPSSPPSSLARPWAFDPLPGFVASPCPPSHLSRPPLSFLPPPPPPPRLATPLLLASCCSSRLLPHCLRCLACGGVLLLLAALLLRFGLCLLRPAAPLASLALACSRLPLASLADLLLAACCCFVALHFFSFACLLCSSFLLCLVLLLAIAPLFAA
jgi:hypothetical protein